MHIADLASAVLKTLSTACLVTPLSICSYGTDALREACGLKKTKESMHGSLTIQTKATLQETKNLTLHQMILASGGGKRVQAPTSRELRP